MIRNLPKDAKKPRRRLKTHREVYAFLQDARSAHGCAAYSFRNGAARGDAARRFLHYRYGRRRNGVEIARVLRVSRAQVGGERIQARRKSRRAMRARKGTNYHQHRSARLRQNQFGFGRSRSDKYCVFAGSLEGQVKAVIELASFNQFTKSLRFLDH